MWLLIYIKLIDMKILDMKIILKNYSDSSEIIEFDRESGFYEGVITAINETSGYFQIYNNKFFAFYKVSEDAYFLEGYKEIRLTKEHHVNFINLPNDGLSSFLVYKSGSLVFDFTYEAWWSSLNVFKPDPFIVEARQEDIEYDFFAYISTCI